MRDIKEKVHEIKICHATKDRRMSLVFIVLLIMSFFALYINFILAIVIVFMAITIPIIFLVKNNFSEMKERLELLEDELGNRN